MGDKRIISIGLAVLLALSGCAEKVTKEPTPSNSTSSKQETPSAPTLNIEVGFHYAQLTADQQKVYRQIAEANSKFESDIDIEPMDKESFLTVNTALVHDYPEFFWSIKESTMNINEDKVVGIKYAIPSNAQEISAQIEDIAQKVIAQAPAGEYEKVKYFYEWIVNNTEYQAAANDQDITSVFIDKRSVCAGYARAFLYLCKKAGIEAAFVSGTARGGTHAWNLVKIRGAYYWVDPTWGDPIFAQKSQSANASGESINYNYLCVSDEELFATHTIDHKASHDSSAPDVFDYPACTDNSLNYYMRAGSYFAEYDYDQIYSYIKNKFENNIYTDIDFKFKTRQAYDAAISDFLESEEPGIMEVFKEVNPEYSGSVSWSYPYSEDSHYFKLSLKKE